MNSIKIFSLFLIASLLVITVSAQSVPPIHPSDSDCSEEPEVQCHNWEFKVRIDKVTHDGSIFTEEYCMRNGFFMRIRNWLHYHARLI